MRHDATKTDCIHVAFDLSLLTLREDCQCLRLENDRSDFDAIANGRKTAALSVNICQENNAILGQ